MHTHLAILLTASVALAAPAAADPGATGRFHVDAEVDPTAYVLDGYSLHVGVGWQRVRLDLGAFGMALPAFAVGNDAFDVSFTGYGAKLQYFPFAEQRGGFIGVDGGVAWQRAERVDSDLTARDRQVTIGVDAGWRFALGDRFYATPWLGVSRVFGASDAMLGGSTYVPSRVIVFPAIHLGVRFE